MAELKIIKNHRDDCTAARPTIELLRFKSDWPNYCETCQATGYVDRSGMQLPCPKCMNGTPYKCPRCGKSPAPEPERWTTGVDCAFCGFRLGITLGAPISDCDCPERVEQVERMEKQFKNKPTAQRDKRARLEALAGVKSAIDQQDDVRRVE